MAVSSCTSACMLRQRHIVLAAGLTGSYGLLGMQDIGHDLEPISSFISVHNEEPQAQCTRCRPPLGRRPMAFGRARKHGRRRHHRALRRGAPGDDPRRGVAAGVTRGHAQRLRQAAVLRDALSDQRRRGGLEERACACAP